ncbi:PucR C-terminal helix-turn-helix domain-containing protein [Evansella caseinilytica]|uniref:PucR C-terminal helix-turn-helix domain-containing protein n=1 Tax=Evansella caseinilytica TaxID=1503961 RepID=A0A1H3PE54_9BACI|nr:PucR family transcriptional regulator [Evansella caseinilytica]SDY99361.1 PucR C-terminal helix-turn-helix domain-containing protein [Evansella caseinilytica]
MKVSAALNLGELKKVKVIAGKNGLHRQIKAAEVMEVPDINEWLTEGILIISTFYSIKDQPEAQIQMFKTLINVNGAGLIIKLGRYVKKLPQEMYDLANEHHMPIIALPLEVSFVNVLTVLFERIYEEKRAYQHEQLRLLKQLVNTSVKNVTHFLTELSTITGENVYLEDENFRLLASAKKQPDIRRKHFHLLSAPQTGLEQGEKESSRIASENRIVIPLDNGGVRIGYLHVSVKGSGEIADTLQHCSTSIQEQTKLLLLKEQYEAEKRYLQESKFLQQLIAEKIMIQQHPITNTFTATGEYLYGLFALDFSPIFEQLQSSHESPLINTYFICKKLYEIFDSRLPETLFFSKGCYFYGTYRCENQQNRPLLIEKLDGILKQAEDEFGCEIYCGVSILHESWLDLSKAYDEAKLALQTGSDMGVKENIFLYEQMGMNKILLKLKYDADVLHLIEVTMAALKCNDREKEEWIHTLDIFLRENGNHSRASEKLFIHRRTLKYRLTKIESLFNIDLADSETRFLFYFLLKMRKLHDS